MKKTFFVLLLSGFIFSALQSGFAQTKNEESNLVLNKKELTGSLFYDSKATLEKFDRGEPVTAMMKDATVEKKSPMKAGLFSLVVPGAGQFYDGNYILSAVFIVVEAAFITTAIIYNHKGNAETSTFENFANQHWSARRYAEWTLDHLSNLNGNMPHDEAYYESKIFPNGRNGNLVWQELNKMETDIGDGYSHNLAIFGTQDYYEIIGKYPQFSHGWDDSNSNDTDYHILSSRFEYYSGMRGHANDLYTDSQRAIVGLYINHVLSALEAVWGAARFNSNLSMRMRLRTINLAGRTEFVPTMNLSYNF